MDDEQLPSSEQKQTMDRLEALRKTTASGREYWLAREIGPVLGYDIWRSFAHVIGKAMAACAGNHLEPAKHFVETGKMVELGSDASRQVVDYFLSRPACYLIAMNGEPTKPEIAGAQAYFAVQTRRMEIQDQRLQDEKRVELRERVSGAFKRVSGVAKQAGVANNKQPVFHDARARGLYGMSGAEVKRAKGLGEKDNLFDRAGPLELSANEFQMNLAADVISREKVSGEQAAINRNYQVAVQVRKAMAESKGTMLEKVPLEEPIALVRKRLTPPKQKNLPKPPTEP